MTGRLATLLLGGALLAGCPQPAATCTDGRTNGLETDVDCGGGACPACPGARICLGASDCASGECVEHRCLGAACDDGARNGAETDLDCGGGTCGPCADGRSCRRDADCASAVCLDGTCGGSSACGAPLLACAATCVDPRVDHEHCGGCGLPCAAESACVGGQCVALCAGGTLLCGPGCVDPGSNPAHCGGCNQPCGVGQLCVGGLCFPACPPGQDDCGGTCRSLDRDPTHCGLCGRQCSAGAACVGGQCVTSCQAPLLACVTGPTCVDPRNDPDHCGGCGMPCPAVAGAARACVNNACVLGACVPGFENCNALPGDGCEAALGFDSDNCGACGASCNPPDGGTDGGLFCDLGRCCEALPPGSYLGSCAACEACGGVLSCLCDDAMQNPTPTSIPLGPCPNYTNCNGVLLCDAC